MILERLLFEKLLSHSFKLLFCFYNGFLCAAVPEWFAAGAFGLVTIFTLLLRNVPALQSNLLYEISLLSRIFFFINQKIQTVVYCPTKIILCES